MAASAPAVRREEMRVDPFTTPGAFSWSELLTSEPEAAAQFYAGLFGWQFDTMNMGPAGPYRVVKVGGEAVGGIMSMPATGQAMPPNWCPYVTVADVDATAAKCTELGGTVMVPPSDVPGVGRFAVIADPQGAVLNVMAYRPATGGP